MIYRTHKNIRVYTDVKEKAKEGTRERQVFLVISCQYTNAERILTIMQQWIQTKLIFAVRDIGPREGLINARQALYHGGISSASGKIYQSIVKLLIKV